MPLYLISGGPGAGKTTLLEALREAGFAGAEEVSRRLIREQVALGSTLVPWQDLAGFAQLALARMVQQHEAAVRRGGITFFDRGLPDLVAYLEAAGHRTYRRLGFEVLELPKTTVSGRVAWLRAAVGA
jgi:predicted ATPase